MSQSAQLYGRLPMTKPILDQSKIIAFVRTRKELDMDEPFLSTVADPYWLVAHWAELVSCLPKELEPINQEGLLRIGYRFKLFGIDWRSTEELAAYFVVLEKIGMIVRTPDGMWCGNPVVPVLPTPVLN